MYILVVFLLSLIFDPQDYFSHFPAINPFFYMTLRSLSLVNSFMIFINFILQAITKTILIL